MVTPMIATQIMVIIRPEKLIAMQVIEANFIWLYLMFTF